MKLKNVLIVVDDIEVSKRFYKELFGLEIIADFGGNVILTEGLVLQEKQSWETYIGKEITNGHHSSELYFEENQMDLFLEKLERTDFKIQYVVPPFEHGWGQRIVRIYDPDFHMIEVGESMEYVARRFLAEGMSPKEVANKTMMPQSVIEMIAAEDAWPE